MRFEKEPLFKKTELKQVYYDPSTGYTGIDKLQARTGLRKATVEGFLKAQDTYTLHRPIRRKFQRRRVYAPAIDHQFQIDLVDMRSVSRFNGGHTYILTCIDVFSKYAFAAPLKHKTGQEVAVALERIFQERVPALLSSDKGLEFKNPHVRAVLEKYSVKHFHTESELKAVVVERFNRTLKDRMFKYFTATGTKKWIDILPQLIINYNTSKHRSIGMTPAEASLPENSGTVFSRLYPPDDKTYKTDLRVGDKVRIYKKEGDFRRGFTTNYTEEVFQVQKIEKTKPITYILRDKHNETIQGKFYKEELSQVSSSSSGVSSN